jgi:plasmid stabilization system protein ParE
VNTRVRFEDEAEAECRLAGRYYEERREHLGLEFFDAVDATIDRILEFPRAGALVPRVPPDLAVRRGAVMRFP